MRTLSRRREEYVGEWLPEPLLTSPDVRRGCRARGERLDRDVDCAGNTRAHGARRVRAPPGFRYAARGDRPGPPGSPGRGATDRASGTRACGGSAAAAPGEPFGATSSRRALPRRIANRTLTGADARHGTGRGADRR